MAKLIIDAGTIFGGTIEKIRKSMILSRPRFRVITKNRKGEYIHEYVESQRCITNFENQ